MFTRIIERETEREGGKMVGRVKGECGGEEKENDEGTTSIVWTRFGKRRKREEYKSRRRRRKRR